MKTEILILTLAFLYAGAIAQSNPAGRNQEGIAKNYLHDKTIQSNPAVIFASGFENGFDGWTAFNEKVSEIVTDPDAALSGNKILKSTATRGVNTGGDVEYKIAPGQEQIYLRFYAKLDENTINPHHFVKIRAIKEGFWPNAGKKPEGDKGFWTGIEPLENNTWHFYSYWHDMHSWQSREGKPDGRPNPYYGNTFNVSGQTPFKKGEWVCVEAMMKANTPGQNDGEQAFWINGEKIGHWKKGEPSGEWRNDRFVTGGDNPQPFEGFNWRTTEDLKINKIVLQWYISPEHMERKKATQDENSVFFDNVVVATEYIGPMYDENGIVLGK